MALRDDPTLSRQSTAHAYEQVHEAAMFLRTRLPAMPHVAIVLGSGLGDFAARLESSHAWDYADLPHWPVSRVVGHAGRLSVGSIAGETVAVLAGRVHLYEGHSAAAVTFAIRVLTALGVKTLVLTNAAGGINTTFARGALMAIDDHINLMGANPLVGPNDERFGPRFPDMTEVYSARLRSIADAVARAQGFELAHGVYVGLLGPSYETPAEIRFLRAIGADAVGMSTVPEAIAARHQGLDVLGLSCITNMAAGVLPTPLDHAEVMETAARVKDRFAGLLEGIIARLRA
ncbi:MAG: purine-nucleoside phosphorylase [Vicinamibacterales bacterium]